MLRSLFDHKGFSIQATDGEIGKVDDFFFDDEHWVVRYLVVDTGGWLTGRKVLVSPRSVKEVDFRTKKVLVDVTRERVEGSPAIAAAEPVSRQYEERYFAYYGWPYYWMGPYAWGPYPYPSPTVLNPEVPPVPEASGGQRHGDPHLRSAHEVKGYEVRARDDESAGHVDDFLLDPGNWGIHYLVVDTGPLWFGHKILVAPDWTSNISWPENRVYVDMTAQQVKDAPAFESVDTIDDAYEARLRGYHGRKAS
jgi:uncharacterized protein YrrD